MKKIAGVLFSTCCLFCLLFPLAAGAEENARLYTLFQQCESSPELYLNKIVASKGETRFYLEFIADGWGEIGIHPPNSSHAFYVADPDEVNTLPLRAFSGIPQRPETVGLEDGKACAFVLVFDEIPWQEFHLIEGLFEADGENMWVFPYLQLPPASGRSVKRPMK